MQKLVYLAHGWHLAIYDEPLVDDEYAEAWKYGPVFPSLYYEFRHRGRFPIVNPATELEFLSPDDFEFKENTPKIPKSDRQTCRLLDRIWEVYGGRTALQLSEITHRPGSPWHQTRKKAGNKNNINIEDDNIKKYYENRLEENRRI